MAKNESELVHKSDIDTLNQKISNQREEIKRLRKCLFDVTNSRDYWKSKANHIGKQFQEHLKDHPTEKGCEQE